MQGGTMIKLKDSFYEKSSLDLSKQLLGKILTNVIDGNRISGRIVEVEAYMGIDDKAAHSYGGKRTERTEIMYGKPGLMYVFMIYGMYYCANIVAGALDVPQAVLIRALEPVDGHEEMSKRRFNKSFNQLTNKEKIKLTNGPGKLCMAMGINKTFNGLDLSKDNIFLEDDGYKPTIITSKRIGIAYAEDAVDFPWRFYIKDNKYVSVK